MTLALLVAGVAAALAGTRLAALAFAGAAAAASVLDGPAVVAIVVTASLAAVIVAVRTTVRSAALPAAGATAVLLAATAPNAALVLPAWIAGTVAAVLSAPSGEGTRRWRFLVVLSDVVLVAAVVAAVANPGFVPWPPSSEIVFCSLMLAVAVLKAPVAAGPLDRTPEPGLLVVRAQAMVALLVLVDSPPDVHTALVVAGAVGFGAAPLFQRSGVRDAVQELGMLAVLLGQSPTGRVTAWVWGTAAAGTLLHAIRLAGRPSGPVLRTAWDAVRSGGVGAVLLPPAAAAVAAADGPAGALVVVGVVAGLAGRLRSPADAALRPTRGRTAAAAGVVVAALAAGVSLWPSWVVPAVVVVAGAVGAALANYVAPSRTRRPVRLTAPSAPSFVLRLADAGGVRFVLPVLWAVLGAVAAAIWMLGAARGFL